jgi:NAD(P)-dependent dehydrogenase (short-subunit alcohol dehydrogenase family)
MFDFSDRVVMLTGASGNVGRAVGRAFFDAGAKLALIDRHQDLLHEAFPELIDLPNCFMIDCADLTDSDQVNPVVGATLDNFGRIDVMINTVGGFRAGTPIHETPVETWDFMMDLNGKAVFIVSKAIIPQMIRQKSGKIVHIAARPGLEGRANMAAYSASKSAVIRLTESAGDELKDKGINFNCILPGTIDTPENRKASPEADFNQWVKPESLADVILFLASDTARDIHGAAIPVYGLT